MEKKKDKKYDFGCTVIIFLFFIGATTLISYKEGTKKETSDTRKEIMKTKEIKVLQDRLDWIRELNEEESNTEIEKDILLQHRKDVILKKLETLTDTLESVSIDHIRKELDNIKWDVIFIDDFENLND